MAKTYPVVRRHSVAFLGLGTMGYPMAGHLQRAGHDVCVYNRTTEKAKTWTRVFGGRMAMTPFDAVREADIVFACVGNDDDLRSVVLGRTGAFAGMKKGAVFVDHTTASANVERELSEVARTLGLGYIDAPVSGGQSGAENGSLTILCGGEKNIYDSVSSVLSAYGVAMTHLGAVGAGQLAKMVNQICIAGCLQGLSEALAFGMNAGLDMHQVLQAIGKGAASSWQMVNRGNTMVDGKFDFGFAVDWMVKDLNIVREEAKRNGSDLPVTEMVERFYAEIQQNGGGRVDTSSLIIRLPKQNS